jgi:DUF4097 and DUF4098 domain-containing protein YvlB
MFPLPAVALLLSLASPPPAPVAWHKSFSLKGRPEIQVVSNNADVRVYASDRKDIEAVLYAGRAISSDAITDRNSGNLVELDVRLPRAGLSQASTVLELTIPPDCDVDVRSRNGSIVVKGAKGKLILHTDKGNIEALGVTGTVDVQSGHGDLQLDGAVTGASLHTGAGNIAAQIDPGSKMNSNWMVRTGDGNIDLRLPEDFSTDLDVNTGDGDIRLDFPMARIGGGRQSSFRGAVNGGGQHLEVHCNKGNVMLRKIAGHV